MCKAVCRGWMDNSPCVSACVQLSLPAGTQGKSRSRDVKSSHILTGTPAPAAYWYQPTPCAHHDSLPCEDRARSDEAIQALVVHAQCRLHHHQLVSGVPVILAA
jgi:hypothetical protein